MATYTVPSSQIANTTTTPLVITKPSSLGVGDLLVASMIGQANPQFTLPSGWTKQYEDISGNSDHTVLIKVADAADVAATNFSFAFTGGTAKVIGGLARITPPTGSTIILGNSSGLSSTSTASYSTTTITPTSEMGLLIMCAANIDTSTTSANTTSSYAIATNNPASWTELYDASASYSGSENVNVAFAYAIRPEPTATGTVSAAAVRSAARISLFIMNFGIPTISTLSMTSTVIRQESIRIVLPNPLSITASIIDPVVSEVQALWNNLSKTISSWVNTPKT